MTMLQHGSVPSTGGYQIERSLRFNSADSAYLNRTPASAGNRKTWTWSGWVKKATNGITACMFGAGGSDGAVIRFETNDTIRCYDYSGSFAFNLQTTQVFRDPSAWYHVVLTYDSTQSTSSDRAKLYVNGSQITAFSSSTYPSLNQDAYFFNNNVLHRIGAVTFVNSNYLDGYLTEVYFIDGSAKTPSDFGENDTDTGVWKPKAYSGTYGTNGFYLKFADNSGTTSTTLGKDSSGNGNNWTPNNFSVTAGAGNDSLVDTPTPYGVDTGAGGEVRGNYATLNPLKKSASGSINNGNLDVTHNGNGGEQPATFAVSSGKWYWEASPNSAVGAYGIIPTSATPSANSLANGYHYYGGNGLFYTNASGASYGATFTSGDVIGIALDLDSNQITFYKNGVSQGAKSISAGEYFPDTAAGTTNTSSVNFGQRPFAYTAPSGYKALCTTNLPTPAIGATSTTRAGKYFNPVLWTGTGSTQTITGVGFEPDFIWMKDRSTAGRNHYLFDRIRGITNARLFSNLTDAENTSTTYINSTNSDGYQLAVGDAGSNGSGETYVGWNWKANGAGSSNTQGTITSTVSANTTSGFSIVTCSPSGSAFTVGHGLGAAPRFIISKLYQSTADWNCYHASLGSDKYVILNSTSAALTSTTLWQNTAPTSTVLSFAAVSAPMLFYCFAPVAGYSAFGSYVGNGSADGSFVYTGFRPAYILIKKSSTSGGNWWVIDNKRDAYNVTTKILAPSLSDAESSGTWVDFTSNGFKIRTASSDFNDSGQTHVYAAFAEVPTKFALAR